ncbi:MAG: hypothetical protein AAB653_01195 [Patescibacteria group bacterium]
MLELSELILFNGNWEEYEEKLYSVFKSDFLDGRVCFLERKVEIIKEPKFKDREWSFWHLTSTGRIESEREPDFRKCERIGWIKLIIESFPHDNIISWEIVEKGRPRICLCYGDWEYLVILKKVHSRFILITAHPIDFKNTKNKLKRQYEEYLKIKKDENRL